jgi:hypothetical protein
MTSRQAALAGGGAGLIVSAAILLLMAYGVSGVMSSFGPDLRAILWPGSLALTVGWRSTASGVLITTVAVVSNVILYSIVAVVLRGSIHAALARRTTAR